VSREAELEKELRAQIAVRRYDPLGFVLFAFPWGVPGTPLADKQGPQPWQAQELIELGLALSTGNRKTRRAVASGKGIGKSALISWVALYLLCTFPDTKVVLTAGTEPQLRTKTMPEIAKWFRMLICNHWFNFTATSIYVKDPDPAAQKAWRLDAIPWNESNPEAFQGLHNQGKRIGLLFDEASQIKDPIFDASDGAFSDADTEVAWLCYGNPTRGIGRFREAFGPNSRWVTRSIDSRTVQITDKQELQELIDLHGEDSDYVRWTIRGLFPRVADTQFISPEIVEIARKNEAIAHLSDPLILGVDVARFGTGKTVLAPRKGRDARTIPWRYKSGADVVEIAQEIRAMNELYKFDAIFIDEGGVGGGVVDLVKSWNLPNVRGVQFGGKSDRVELDANPARYTNKRSEMWGTMKEMLPKIAIPNREELQKELTAALYGYKNDNEIQLVSKEVMLRQHQIPSPDEADALCLTFAYPVQKLLEGHGGGPNMMGHNGGPPTALTDYDPFA
jgi:hypothetical protein